MKHYLGDGAYAEYDGFSIILTTENGIEVTNTVVLEPEVLAAFLRFVTTLRCDCIALGNVNKPKQHGADPHAKNCKVYTS